jgi:hypothetical protein
MKYRCLGCVIISLVVCMRYNQPSIWAPHTTSILLFSILLIPHRPLLFFNKLPDRNKQTNKQTNNQSINQSIATTHEPPRQTDRQPNNHKIFLLPMSRLTCFHPTSATKFLQQSLTGFLSSTSQSGFSKYSLTPTYDDEDCKTSHYLGAEAYDARGRTNSQEARQNSCHLHLHEVVMWGKDYATARGCVRRHSGTTKLHFLTHPLLLSQQPQHLETLFALWRDPPPSSPRYEECREVLSTSQIFFSKFVLINIFPRLLVCTKVQACATHVPKVPWLHLLSVWGEVFVVPK